MKSYCENTRKNANSLPSHDPIFLWGHTVYVYGYGVTEDILKNQFTPYGPIVNISMEVEKNCGFITYEKVIFRNT